MSLQIISSVLDKVSVDFNTFGGDGGFATVLDLELPLIHKNRNLQVGVCESNDNGTLISGK
jgi:hypothetical protein